MKAGIEMEFWVVDSHGRLCDGQDITEAHDRIKPEFIGPLIELQTSPHERTEALGNELREILETAIDAAERVGKQLVPLGTPLTEASPPATTERGRVFETIYGDGIRSAKNCAGTHIHFEKGNVLRQLNLLTALDPALALVSSSPYYLGKRGMDSARAFAYRKKCGCQFTQFCDLWRYAESVEEWEDRVENAFDAFKTLGAQRGVPSEVVTDFFTPEDTVLTPVRLRTCLPTVEWRAPDTALPSQIVRLADDMLDLLRQTESKTVEFGTNGVRSDRIEIPEFSALQDISSRAISRGLQPRRVRQYLRKMEFDVSAYRPMSKRLRGEPTLGESEARDVRLEVAKRLRDDVQSLSVTAPARASVVDL